MSDRPGACHHPLPFNVTYNRIYKFVQSLLQFAQRPAGPSHYRGVLRSDDTDGIPQTTPGPPRVKVSSSETRRGVGILEAEDGRDGEACFWIPILAVNPSRVEPAVALVRQLSPEPRTGAGMLRRHRVQPVQLFGALP